MEKLVKNCFILLFFFVLIAFFAPSANAWDCMPYQIPEDLTSAVGEVDAVVYGKVLEKKPIKIKEKDFMYTDCVGEEHYVRLQVEKSWNRHAPSEIIFIEAKKAKAGRNVEVGDEVVVYLDIINKGKKDQRYQSRVQLHNVEKAVTRLEEAKPVYTPEKEVSLAWDMKIINLLKWKSTAYLIGFFLLLCTITGLVVRHDAKQVKGGEDHEKNE